MFLKNYLPRSEKNEIKISLKYLKFALMFLLLYLVVIQEIKKKEFK